MCGILGYLGYIDSNSFKKSLNTLIHRGPDAEGIWSDEYITLGHRRLSIVDLSSNASQPMHLNSRYSIVFNGEIYNFIELKAELSKSNLSFHSNSDTEVILKAFEKWGEKCFEKFNGMWAIAIWDNAQKKLTLSRDRMGKKPLFYGFKNNHFFFASEMKALYNFLPSFEINYTLAQQAILNGFSYESTENCLINGIKRFPAGSIGTLFFNDVTLKTRSFWNPFETKLEIPKNYSDKVLFFRDLFIDACKVRMQSDVSIGTALSGGLDSSSVICTMSYIAKKKDYSFQKNWQHAFIASFPGTSIDETKYAKQVTDYLKIDNPHFINIDPIKELNNIYFQTFQFEELFFAPTIPFVQLYRSIRDNNVKVSIDGHGADELFAGYPFDIEYALLDDFPNIKTFINTTQTIKNIKGLTSNNSYNYLKYVLKNKYKLFQKISNNINPIQNDKGKGYLNSRLYESTFKTVLPTLLRNYDRYSMINSVEIRMPFLDYRIVEFAFNTNNETKLKNGFSKNIIRDALKDIVPESILHRKKKIGFNSPINFWMKNEMKTWILDVINSKDFMECDLINGVEIKNKLEKIIHTKMNLSFNEGEKYFALLTPYIWKKSLSFVQN